MKSLVLIVLLLFGFPAFSDQNMQEIYQDQAKKCTELKCIRAEIDQINDAILKLLVQRTAYVQRAGDLKLKTKIANDQKRVDEQLKLILSKSEKLGLPKEVASAVFQALIQKSIQFEQEYINSK